MKLLVLFLLLVGCSSHFSNPIQLNRVIEMAGSRAMVDGVCNGNRACLTYYPDGSGLIVYEKGDMEALEHERRHVQ